MAKTFTVGPDNDFIHAVLGAGGADMKKCYQCAACTSVCALSTEQYGFPRKQMLLAQWGMKDKLMEDPGPWLCYYCGDCTKVCPRQANPAETMMAMRRYLTTQYDWTGLSRRMYSSGFWEVGVLALVSAVVILLFTLPHNFGFGLLAHSGPAALTTVMLDRFAPIEIAHRADQLLALVLGLFLFSNAARMFFHLTRGRNVPASLYFTYLPVFALHGLTQIRWKSCNGGGTIKNWLRHLFLVSGYATMFILVVIFLPWFQVQNSSLHWTSFLGYYATVVLLVTTAWILVDRVRKQDEIHQFSHLSDWLFPLLLFFSALSGILLNVLRLLNLPMPTYVAYTAHWAIVVPMLVVEVPFGKWAHLLYRPLAIYLAAVRNRAMELSAGKNATMGQMVA
jgi:ferredoxin